AGAKSTSVADLWKGQPMRGGGKRSFAFFRLKPCGRDHARMLVFPFRQGPCHKQGGSGAGVENKKDMNDCLFNSPV
ncbi:MAG TPA: hypothetical protein VFF98_17680, partial [Novosphingobium sp.]|nr:hypothetical protein [Novosphingobium sp.]